MASEIKSPTRPALTASARQAAKVKGYVNQQLEKTRKQVKTIDFISGALVLVAFTVGFLLFAAMIDAWIWPLSRFGRWSFLLIWLGSCLGYTATSIVPLLVKRINPDYAAKMIEDAKPSFSNSLMNYVSLRKRPEGIRPAVLDAVSRQAATDLASVPGDTAVDQSKMIRIGFVLVGLTLLAVSYKILSPKDPLSTVARIFAPASDISQPAAVTIDEVLPGDVEIFFGETLEVTARVSGRHQAEDVRLIYSTVDGQLVDQSLSMAETDEQRKYRGTIAMPGGGVQASLQYRVVAKDGVSRDYAVTVRPNPTIAIESLLFDPPDYTGLASRTLMGVGDIDAIEGTLVTINAIANLPIKSAEVELLNEVINLPGDAELSYEKRFVPVVGSKYIMEVEGRAATQAILVKLDANRKKPFATHYRLKFTSVDDSRNSQPNVYAIRVTPDLAPDVEIKNPVETDGQIPQNQVLAIDIVASDLDFSIDSVDLSIDHNGRSLFSDSLILDSKDGNRRVTARYLLNPTELGLKPGDSAIFHATAKDNRMQGLKPDSNVSRTQNYSVTIQRPEENSSDPVSKNPDGEGQNGEGQDGEGQDGEGQDGEGQDGEGQDGEGQDGEGQDGEGQDGEGQDGEGQDGEGQNGEGQNGEGQNGEGQDGEGQNGEGQNGEGQNGEGQNGEGQNGEGQDGEGQDGEGQDGEGQNGEGQNGEGQDGEGQNGEGQNGEGQNGEGQNGEGQNGEGQNGEGQNGEGQNGEGQNSSGGGSQGNDSAQDGGEGQQDSSLTDGSQKRMSKNASDGERMRKLQEFLEEQSQKNSSQEDKAPEDGTSGESGNSEGSPPENGNSDMNADQGSSDPVSKNPDGEGQDGEGQNGEGQNGEGQNGEGQNGEGQNGEGQNGEGQNGEGQNGEGQNGEGQNGEGQNGEGQNGEGQNGEGQDGEGQNGEGQDGEGQNGEGQDGEGQNGEGQNGEGQNGEGQNGEGQNGEGQDGEGQDGEGQNGEGQNGEGQDGEGQNGEGQNGEGQDGEGQDGEGQNGEGQNGEGQNGEGQDGEGQNGEGQNGEGQNGEGQNGEGQNGEGQNGEGQNGEGQNGEGQNGEGQNGEGQNGEGQNGEGQNGEGQNGEGQNGEGQNGAGEQAGSGGSEASSSQTEGSPSGESSQSASAGGAQDSSAMGTGAGGGAPQGEMLERDKTNLDHAKKATDMVLKKLSDQRYDPDPELLDKMNWTKADLENFLRRWEEMKDAADVGTLESQKKYENSLRSLGLRPKSESRRAKTVDESAEGLGQDSAVNRPPAERVPDFNSFMRDLNRANDN